MWAAKKLPEFAVAVQPFFSDATAANFTIDFISTVREIYNQPYMPVNPLLTVVFCIIGLRMDKVVMLRAIYKYVYLVCMHDIPKAYGGRA